MNTSTEVALICEEGEIVWTGTIAEFAADNDENAEDIAQRFAYLARRGLRTPLTFGGGAAPLFHLCLVVDA